MSTLPTEPARHPYKLFFMWYCKSFPITFQKKIYTYVLHICICIYTSIYGCVCILDRYAYIQIDMDTSLYPEIRRADMNAESSYPKKELFIYSSFPLFYSIKLSLEQSWLFLTTFSMWVVQRRRLRTRLSPPLLLPKDCHQDLKEASGLGTWKEDRSKF